MNFRHKPLQNFVVAKKIKPKDQMKGSLYLPEKETKNKRMVKIIAVGPGLQNMQGEIVPIPLKAGDVCFTDDYTWQDVTIEGEDFHIIRADHIVLVLEDAPDEKKAEYWKQDDLSEKK